MKKQSGENIVNTLKIIFAALLILVGITSSSWGSNYGDSLINHLKQESKLELFGPFDGIPKENHLYSAYPENVDWSKGYTTVFVGIRKDGYPARIFRKQMAHHIDLVRRAFRPMGLQGYLFIMNGDFEIAYQNWSSESDAQKAFGSQIGQSIIKDANTFLNGDTFEQVTVFEWLNNLSK